MNSMYEMEDNILFLGNTMTLLFDKKNGVLTELLYKDKKIALGNAVWEIETIDKDNTIATVTPMELGGFTFKEQKNRLDLYWSSERMKVHVKLVFIQNEIKMKINTEVYHGQTSINKVIFPIIGYIHPLSGGGQKDYLVLPWQNGFLINNPIKTLLDQTGKAPFWGGRDGNKYENDYPAQFSYQFMAYYSDDFGLYFATKDPDAFMKTMGLYLNQEKTAFSYAITQYPENMGKTKEYHMPYDFTLKVFEGDWQKAALLYREWAVQQKWCKNKNTEKYIPENILKTDLWRINHTNFALGKRTDEYVETCRLLKEKLGCNLGLHWYGWNMGWHDLHYPDYINHKIEGWDEKLLEYNKQFTKEGIAKIPYVNARLWDSHDRTWKEENAYASAIKDQSGELVNEPWNPQTVLVPMCPGTKMWRERVIGFCREYIKKYGFDGIYIDQIASYYATLCFDGSHNHPLGGGSWWNDSYHEMINGLREQIGEEKILTSESCCETYSDVFDIFLILDMNSQYSSVLAGGKNQEAIPLFNMIYGDYMLTYGSICLMKNEIKQFEFNLIRNTLWGILPSIDGFEMSEMTRDDSDNYFSILKEVVDFYKENKELIIYGRPKEVLNVENGTFELSFGQPDNVHTKTYSEIFAVKWENSDGHHFIVAYNFSNNEINIQICDTRVCLASHKLKCFEINN